MFIYSERPFHRCAFLAKPYLCYRNISCLNLKRLGGQKFLSTLKNCSVFVELILLTHSFMATALAGARLAAQPRKVWSVLVLINMLISAWPRRPRQGRFAPSVPSWGPLRFCVHTLSLLRAWAGLVGIKKAKFALAMANQLNTVVLRGISIFRSPPRVYH